MAWVTVPDSDVDPESPITTGLMIALRDNPVAIAGRLSGAPLVIADQVYDQGAGGALKLKVVDIGDWDMNASNQVSINHGLTTSNIRAINAHILHDAGILSYNIHYTTTVGALGGGIVVTSATSQVILQRVIGGFFDTTDFDSTPFNRGWIFIWFVDP